MLKCNIMVPYSIKLPKKISISCILTSSKRTRTNLFMISDVIWPRGNAKQLKFQGKGLNMARQ